MALKIIFIMAFIVMLASLGSGLYHLIRYKQGKPYLLRSLIFRIIFAIIVILILIYGLYTGEFHLSAPWLGA